MEYSSFSMVLYKTSVFLYEPLNNYTIRLMGDVCYGISHIVSVIAHVAKIRF